MSLFRRNIELVVTQVVTGVEVEGGLTATSAIHLKDLNIEFNIDSDRSVGPDTLEAWVYGANEDTRYRLRKARGAKVEVRFGYDKDSLFTIFKGDMRSSAVVPEGGAPVVKIEAGSGERAHYQWFSKSYGKGARFMTVVDDLVDAMGVLPGNVDDVAGILETNGMSSQLKHGARFSGHAVDAFTKLMSSRGIEWSIKNDAIQVLGAGKAITDDKAVPTLGPKSGLVGTPSINNKGVMECDCLIQQYIYPGRMIDIESKFLGDRKSENTSTSRFKVTKANYVGSLYGDCKIAIEGRRVKA